MDAALRAAQEENGYCAWEKNNYSGSLPKMGHFAEDVCWKLAPQSRKCKDEWSPNVTLKIDVKQVRELIKVILDSSVVVSSSVPTNLLAQTDNSPALIIYPARQTQGLSQQRSKSLCH